jgi:nucleoside-diphosphate-sugar epimerase
MTDLYLKTLRWPEDKINGRIYNAGYYNFKVREIADMVRRVVGPDVNVVTTPTDDNRSYHISSERIRRDLGFEPQRNIQDAARDLMSAFTGGLVPEPMNDDRYYNIKRMQRLQLN